MELATAFLLGLLGSLHCAGMCGPLMLALPATGGTPAAFAAGRLVNAAGRLTMYALLGGLLGVFGQSLALAGLQRWVSIAAGVAILAGLLASPRLALATPGFQLVAGLKKLLGGLLRRRSPGALFVLGALNGLLPCGLVYAAGAGALATGGTVSAVTFMLAFGTGTMPMMLGIGLLGRRLPGSLVIRLRGLVPVTLAVVGAMLILRGLELGIPLLSPVLSTGARCH
jgi:sulfite exporter TauE/SafE